MLFYPDSHSTGPAMVIAGSLVFYGALSVNLLAWLLALQKSEAAVLLARAEVLGGGGTGDSIAPGRSHSVRWGNIWVCYTLVVLTGWFFGITLHFGGTALLLFPVRQYARIADDALRGLPPVADGTMHCPNAALAPQPDA